MRRLMFLAVLLFAGGFLLAASCTDDYRDELPLRPLGDLSYQLLPDMAVPSDMVKGPSGNADMPAAVDSGSATDLPPSSG
jgi:hypothetical protein